MATLNYEHLDETSSRGPSKSSLTRRGRRRGIFWREEWVPSSSYQKSLSDEPGDRLWCAMAGRSVDGAEVSTIHFHKLKGTMHTINFTVRTHHGRSASIARHARLSFS